MSDWVDSVLITILGVCVVLTVGIIGFVTADALTTAEGTVVNKFYDDRDLTCAKVCTVTPECWVIVVDSEPWWNSDTCVSESKYHTINVGDYFRE